MKSYKEFSGFFLLFLPAFCLAQEPRFPVYLSHDCSQPKSSRFLFELKEAIRSSSGLRLVEELGKTPEQVRLACIDTQDGICYSMARTFPSKDIYPAFAGHYLGVCGESVLQECARDLLATISNNADETKSLLREIADERKKSKAEIPSKTPKD